MSSDYVLKNGELEYLDYQERQYAEVLPEALKLSANKIKFGHKFQFVNNGWLPLPYKGYAVVSMVTENPENELLKQGLLHIQDQILQQTGLISKLYPLPADSFHQTIANTLSNERFYKNVGDAGLEDQYPALIEEAFQQISLKKTAIPLPMKLIGLSIFNSAMGILGVFEDKYDYEKILSFREQFYNYHPLNQLDVKRTRPFIGHITLFYFERGFSQTDKEQLASVCNTINEHIKASDLTFLISNTQLRTYENLGAFHHRPSFPTFSF